MKPISWAGIVLFLLTSVASASTTKVFHCVETEESKEENDYSGTFSFQIIGKKMKFTSNRKGAGQKSGVAQFDRKIKNQLRYIDLKAASSTSDAEASIFVSERLLTQGRGRITLSGCQGNESDSGGPEMIWFVNAVMDCE